MHTQEWGSSLSEWQFPGSRWWRFDFHAHTPASQDFKDSRQRDGEEVTPEQWLRRFMEKGLDCVAITDHNSGEWIDKLKLEMSRLEQEKPGLVSSSSSVPWCGNISAWRCPLSSHF